jgi:hypothetical protein
MFARPSFLRHGYLPLAAATLAILVATPAAATPVVSLSWNACTSPIDVGPVTAATHTVVVTAQGLPSAVTGFQFAIGMRANYSGLADAWRFDSDGCNAGRWQALVQQAGPGCPALRGSSQPLVTAQYDYVVLAPGSFPTGRIRFGAAYMPAATPGPGPYTVAKLVFDLSNGTFGGTSGDSCGCLGRMACWQFMQVSYFDAGGVEYPIVIAQDYLTWNDPHDEGTVCNTVMAQFSRTSFPDTSCVGLPVPARGTSWGRVKGTYRERVR